MVKKEWLARLFDLRWLLELRWVFVWILGLSLFQVKAFAINSPEDMTPELGVSQPYEASHLSLVDLGVDPQSSLGQRQLRQLYQADCGNRLATFIEQLSDLRRQALDQGVARDPNFANALSVAEAKKAQMKTILGVFIKLDGDEWQQEIEDLEGAFQDLDMAVSNVQQHLYAH